MYGGLTCAEAFDVAKFVINVAAKSWVWGHRIENRDGGMYITRTAAEILIDGYDDPFLSQFVHKTMSISVPNQVLTQKIYSILLYV